jgi:hypothetical protein
MVFGGTAVSGATIRYALSPVSANSKTGRIAVASTSRATCWKGCAFHGKCYAEDHYCGSHWTTLDASGLLLPAFVDRLGALPSRIGEPARWAEKGDLPGQGSRILSSHWGPIQDAMQSTGRRWFGYTHKPVDARTVIRSKIRTAGSVLTANRDLIAGTNSADVCTVNLSANSLRHADILADLDIGPVVATVPADTTGTVQTPDGRPFVQCPATYRADISCGGGRMRDGTQTKACGGASGPLCWQPNRAFGVYFPAHGSRKRHVGDVSRGWDV